MALTEAQVGAEIAQVRVALEELNEAAGDVGIWVRTQPNAPSQRPWFSEKPERGNLASGRVGVGQVKTLPYHWRWEEFSPFLMKVRRDCECF